MMVGPYENFKRFYQGELLSARILREVRSSSPCLFLIQDISNTQQIFRRPDVDVNLLCRPGVSVPEDGTNKLDGNAFSVQGRGEIVPNRVGSEPRSPGSPGKLFTEAVQAAS